MRLRRLDDYQSWALEHAGRRLLIDPWLSDEHHLPGGHWLFGRRRPAPAPLETWLPADALVLSAHFADHLHAPTLAGLPRALPVFGSVAAAKRARRLGFTAVQALRPDDVFTPWPGLRVEAIRPGFPYAHNSLGFVFAADGQRVYFETHMPPAGLEARGPFDAVVAPMQSVRLLGVPFVQSLERSVALARRLAPRWWLPTGDDPHLGHGLLTRLLFFRDARSDFAQALAAAGATTRFVEPAPGQSFEIPPQS